MSSKVIEDLRVERRLMQRVMDDQRQQLSAACEAARDAGSHGTAASRPAGSSEPEADEVKEAVQIT